MKRMKRWLIAGALAAIPLVLIAMVMPEDVNQEATWTFKVVKTDTISEETSGAGVTINGVSGVTYASARIVDYTTTTSARTVTAAESGYVFTVSDSGGAAEYEVTFNLPTAAVGLVYTFVDMDAAAGADLVIQANTGDTIEDSLAAKEYVSAGDTDSETCTILAVDATSWVVIGEQGTWAKDDS